MAAPVQSVIKNFSEVMLNKVPRSISLYVALLVISKDRKNYASMARENNINYKKVYIKKEEATNQIKECHKFLIELIEHNATEDNPGYIMVDFTVIEKHFANKIPDITYDYDGCKKRVAKGFSAGFIVWSNGKITVPFDYDLWLRKKDVKNFGDIYRKKTEIAQELLLLAKEYGIPVYEVRLDGAFATVAMISFLKKHNIHFTMRIPSNRVVETENEKNQLSKHSQLQLKGNERYKTITAVYKGHELYFTAHKRNGKNGEKEVVFIVSDLVRTAKEHVLAYNERWPTEKYFRSSKQYVGIAHCQSTDADKQQLHIFSIMVAYSVLQCMKYDKRKQSVEEILHPIRRQKSIKDFLEYVDLEATFMC